MFSRFLSLEPSVSEAQPLSFQPSIFIALLLFGQIFCSTLSYFLGIENRLFILPFRALIALYSLYVILRNFVANKSIFLEAFPLSLSAFWFLYFSALFRDRFLVGVVTALPLWVFFAWGIGGCFLPSLACYFLFSNSGRDDYLRSILLFGFTLLAGSSLFFFLSAGLSLQRFSLPTLNPINASHSFFVLALLAVSYLASKYCPPVRSFCIVFACAFGVSMGIYAGSRGALFSFIVSFLVIFLVSRFRKIWLLLPFLFSTFLIFLFNPAGLVSRLGSAGFDLGSTLRLSAIHESILVFLSHPFAGAGFAYHLDLSSVMGYSQMWYPHNFIFESLALGGILLTLPFIFCVCISVRSCLELLKKPTKSDLWIVAFLIQALGYVTFSGHLSNVPMFWVALGLASSFVPIRIGNSES